MLICHSCNGNERGGREKEIGGCIEKSRGRSRDRDAGVGFVAILSIIVYKHS